VAHADRNVRLDAPRDIRADFPRAPSLSARVAYCAHQGTRSSLSFHARDIRLAIADIVAAQKLPWLQVCQSLIRRRFAISF